MKNKILILTVFIFNYWALNAQYEIPVFMNPGDNLQDTIDAYPGGTLYILKEGIHRNQRIIPKDGDIITGEPGAIMNGSLVLDNWIQEGQYWTHTIPAGYASTTLRGDYPDYACEDTYVDGVRYENQFCRYSQSLFKDDLPLWRVTSLDHLDNLQDSTHNGIPVEPFHGDWYFEINELKVYLSFDPSTFFIESTIFLPTYNYGIFAGAPNQGSVTANDVLVKGLTVEKYTSNNSAVITGPEGWVLENNDVKLNHTGGIAQIGNTIVRSNKINRNGQTGIGGLVSDGLVDNNEIAYNNFNRFRPGWSAVTKWIRSDGLILRNNHVHNNYGNGLWADIQNYNTLYEGNYVHDNGGAGIFHEVSFDAIIRCNKVINNRSRTKPGIGDIDPTQSIYISNGSDVLVEHNYIRCDTSGSAIVTTQVDRSPTYPTQALGGCGTPVRIENNDIVYSFTPRDWVAVSRMDHHILNICGDTVPIHSLENNHYHINNFDLNEKYFSHFVNNGDDVNYTWDEFRNAGFEVNGSMDTNIIPTPNNVREINAACEEIPEQMLVKAKLLLDCKILPDATEMTLPNPGDRVHFQPFSGTPWNYSGKDVSPKFYEDMIDWVLLEIREASNPNNLLQQKAAILLKDGSIVDAYPSLLGVAQPGDMIDGVVIYDLIPNEDYVLSVVTRNQTVAMANQAVMLPNINQYDFTNISYIENTVDFDTILNGLVAINCCLEKNTYFYDNDADGFGDPNNQVEDCDQPQGTVTNNQDCDDSNANINPDQIENPYNGLDDDCDPLTLDDDLDQDGFVLADDCDDNNPNINPDAQEIPNNGVDEDCDGMDLISSTHEIGNSIIKIYPNPTIDILNINVEGQLNFQANLYSLDGKQILTEVNSKRLNLETILSGTYLLEIKDLKTGKKVVEKIIVGK